MLRDGRVFYDGQDKTTFSQYSFCELVKYLMVEPAGISYEEAAQRVDPSPLTAPVADVMDARSSTREKKGTAIEKESGSY